MRLGTYADSNIFSYFPIGPIDLCRNNASDSPVAALSERVANRLNNDCPIHIVILLWQKLAMAFVNNTLQLKRQNILSRR